MLAVQTDAYWNASADGYVANAEPFTALFCEDAAQLAAIKPGMTLLDVATGPGAAALAAARRGAIVTAIDFSAAMVARLQARIGDLPISAHRMDGQALDLPYATLDRAVSVFGIPLFPDWRQGLREMARVLRPGGVAVVAVADNAHGFGPNPLLAAARTAHVGVAAPVEIEAMQVLADPARLAAEMRGAGFAAITLHERTHDFVLDPALFVAAHPMIAQNPVLAGLGDTDRGAVIAAAIAEAYRRSDGGVLRLPGTARIVTGVRS
jgi:SAM-dependent methyltransferase